jgi:hypothetical protein
MARHAGATVLANPSNRGFAAAANQGVAAAAGDLVLLLNPDAELLEGLETLESSLRAREDAGAAAGLLVDRAGRPQRGFSVRRLPTFWTLGFEVLGLNAAWPGNPLNRRYRCHDLAFSLPTDVEQPAGACLLVRKSVWNELGGMDERFHPLWFEDVDFCLRLRRRGLRIVLEPRCRFHHHGAQSLALVDYAQRQLFWYRNLLYYVRKNWGLAAAPPMRALVLAGAYARMAAALLRGDSERAGAFRTVVHLALWGRE